MPRARGSKHLADGLPRRRVAAIQRRLLRWYAAHRRRLPWRRARPDPYRVWVAEIMLQQTQISTVIPYYERFVARFCNVAALAAADEEEVLALWSGLGYYSRARSLLRSARLLIERHDGRLPRQRDLIESLPGIGRYTAGAILSIAFSQPEPAVDGNVRRVLTRLMLTKQKPVQRSRRQRTAAGRPRRAGAPAPGAGRFSEPTAAELEVRARDLVSSVPPADFNQAIMELGALVCRPSAPLCATCPLSRVCEARRLGVQEQVPSPRKRPATVRQSRAVALIHNNGRVLVERAFSPGTPRGLWDLPGTLIPENSEPRRHLERHLRSQGLGTHVGARLTCVEHGITFRRIRCTAYETVLDGSALSESPAAGRPARRWVERSHLRSLPMGSAARRLLASCRRPI